MMFPTELLTEDAALLRSVTDGSIMFFFVCVFKTFLCFLFLFLLQDLHLAIEICIEAIFDFFHRATHLLLSPSEAFAIMLSCFSSSPSHSRKERKHDHVSDDDETVLQTATLGDADPSLTERPARLYNTMNTDTRTCQDVITELGLGAAQMSCFLRFLKYFFFIFLMIFYRYPYEAIRVVTSDGYGLLLERIPRYITSFL